MVAIGYCRTSTPSQQAGLEAQQVALVAAGCTKIYSEQVSATAGKRPQLEAALDYAREGDVIYVTKPCRLARSTSDLLRIIERLEGKGVALVIQSMGGQCIDTRSATGKLLLTVMSAISSFEKDLLLERQICGIEAAKAAGAYKGRAPTARAKTAEVLALQQAGHGPVAIAAQLGISRASVQRILAAKKKAA
jgi:DNA invertase Pin-like site-specific DNA recombinase